MRSVILALSAEASASVVGQPHGQNARGINPLANRRWMQRLGAAVPFSVINSNGGAAYQKTWPLGLGQ